MNSTLKNVVIFASGFALGGLLANHILNDYYEELVQEEIEDIRRVMGVGKDGRGMTEEEVKEETGGDEPVINDIYDTEQYDTAETNYNDVSKEDWQERNTKPSIEEVMVEKGYSPEDLEGIAEDNSEDFAPVEEEFAEVIFEPEDDPQDERSVGVITIDEYNNTNDHYDKINLIYYAHDDTLVDEREEIVPDVISLIGDDALDRFGEESYSEDCVFVRNDYIHTDFEVTRVQGTYVEEVLGISTD